MNFRANSTPKPTVMPVRLCHLNLSVDDDDEEEDVEKDPTLCRESTLNKENVPNSNEVLKKFEEIKTKFTKNNYITPIKPLTTELRPESKSNIKLINNHSVLKTSKSIFTIQERENYSTPCNSQSNKYVTKNWNESAKEPQKLIFTPDDTKFSSLSSKTLHSTQKKTSLFAEVKKPAKVDELISKDINISNNEIIIDKGLDAYSNKTSGVIEIKNFTESSFNIDRQITHLDEQSSHKEEPVTKVLEENDTVDFKIPKPRPRAQANSLKSNNVQVQCKDGVINQIIIGEKTYNILKKLGSGGSSTVHLAISTDNLEQNAIKIVNLTGDPIVIEGYMNEVELLSKLQGSDVVIKMFNYVHVPNERLLYMVMECGGSDLNQIIKDAKSKNEIPFPIVKLVSYWIQMLEAVKFIHDNGVVHSDLKPANFLKVNGRLKLIDFGIASNISTDCTSIIKHVKTGTFNYMSPEALLDTSDSQNNQDTPNIKISYKSDVWSLGCILYLLLYGNTPFGHINNYYMKVAAITDPEPKINFPELELYPPILAKTAKRCLVHNRQMRPSVAELLKLPRAPFQNYVE